MKKVNLLWMAAALFVGCAKDGSAPSESAGNVIKFETYVSKSQTRAVTGDITKTNITGNRMLVFGDIYTEGNTDADALFHYEAAKHGWAGEFEYVTDGWEGDKLAFWMSDKKYDFTAVSPSEAFASPADFSYANDGSTSAYTLADGKLTLSNIPASKKLSEGYDILVANKTGVTAMNSAVQLDFEHILSRLSVYIYGELTEGLSDDIYEVQSISLYLPNTTATYSQKNHGSAEGSWAWTAAPASSYNEAAYDAYVLTAPQTALNQFSKETSYEVLKGADGAYKFPEDFFVAPTPAGADATLFLDITFKYRGQDAVYTREKVKVENLTKFRQGFKTNLFIRIAKPDMSIGFTTFTVDENYVDGGNTATEYQK